MENPGLTKSLCEVLNPATLLPTPRALSPFSLASKNEGFQEDHMGWFQKEGLLFLPGNLQWKLGNSLHATAHLGEKDYSPPKITRKDLQMNRPPND